MALRDKTLEYMHATLPPFEDTVKAYCQPWRDGFKQSYEDQGLDPPKEAFDALSLVEKTLTDNRTNLESIVADIFEKAFTEDELDELLRRATSPLGKKLAEFGATVQYDIAMASDQWQTTTIQTIETQLAQLLGDPPEQADTNPPHAAEELAAGGTVEAPSAA